MKGVETGGGSLSLLSHRLGISTGLSVITESWMLDLCLICRLRQFSSWMLTTTHLSAMNRPHIFELFIKVYKQKSVDIISVQWGELLQTEQTV